MKVLLLTYFYPFVDKLKWYIYVSNPLRGIFVTKTIEQYKKIRIDCTAIPIGYGKFQSIVWRCLCEDRHCFWYKTRDY